MFTIILLGVLKGVLICAPETHTIKCDADSVVDVRSAFWGRDDSITCSEDLQTTSCTEPTVVQTIRAMCDNKQECDILASYETLGDPCPRVHKYVRMTYVCLKQGTYTELQI